MAYSHFVIISSLTSRSGSRQGRLFYKSTKVFARLFTSFYFLLCFCSMAERTDRIARELDASETEDLTPACFALASLVNSLGICSRISVEVSSIPHGARQKRLKDKWPSFRDSSSRFVRGCGCISCVV